MWLCVGTTGISPFHTPSRNKSGCEYDPLFLVFRDKSTVQGAIRDFTFNLMASTWRVSSPVLECNSIMADKSINSAQVLSIMIFGCRYCMWQLLRGSQSIVGGIRYVPIILIRAGIRKEWGPTLNPMGENQYVTGDSCSNILSHRYIATGEDFTKST